MKDECVVRMQNIYTRFGSHSVHRDVNLCLRRGEILGLVGASGSGKTTLLREMIGLETPTRGSVRVFGSALNEVKADAQRRLRQRWGVLFQHGALFTALTVYENIALPLRELRLLDRRLIDQLVCLKLEMVGLQSSDAWRLPVELSGGMVKRVALARALALDPELLLLDEPTSGLDPVASENFVELIASLRRELGLTVVLVLHDLDTLVDLCDRIVVLAEERIVAQGPLAEVLASRHPFCQRFFHGVRGRRTFGRLPPR